MAPAKSLTIGSIKVFNKKTLFGRRMPKRAKDRFSSPLRYLPIFAGSDTRHIVDIGEGIEFNA